MKDTPTPLTYETVTGAARRLNVTRDTIERWIRRGNLPALRLPGGRIRIPSGAVDRLLTPISERPR